MSEGREGSITLEHTPTWVVASVCIVIIAISLAVERVHFTSQTSTSKNQKPLCEALQNVKEGLSFYFIFIYIYISNFILRLHFFWFFFYSKLNFES